MDDFKPELLKALLDWVRVISGTIEPDKAANDGYIGKYL
jgi:hypothetical protein